MCEDVCICVLSVCVPVFVCVAVNSHACYRWIVNDITDCNSSFSFSVCVILVWSCMCKMVCLYVCVFT